MYRPAAVAAADAREHIAAARDGATSGWWSWRLAALERRVRLLADAELMSSAENRNTSASSPPVRCRLCGSLNCNRGHCVTAGSDLITRATTAASLGADDRAFLIRHLAFVAATVSANGCHSIESGGRLASSHVAWPVRPQPPAPPKQLAAVHASLLPWGLGVVGSRRRRRTHFTAEQTDALQKAFSVSPYLNYEQRLSLGAATGLNEQIVLIWFKNHRAKIRKLWAAEKKVGGTKASALVVDLLSADESVAPSKSDAVRPMSPQGAAEED